MVLVTLICRGKLGALKGQRETRRSQRANPRKEIKCGGMDGQTLPALNAKMQRADISVALYRVAADVGGPALVKQVNQRTRKAVETMLETAPDIKSPPDKFAIEIMLSAMGGAMRSLLESGPSPATVRKAREQLALLCQSYMAAATEKRV